jgi:hypothetical protein
MLICVLLEAFMVGVWYAIPPARTASSIPQFAYSYLFGVGLMAGMRVKGLWRRLLLLVPALAVMILCETIVPRLAEGSSHWIGAYLGGFFFGMFLMVFAFIPRGVRSAPKS